jgi:hypothetical protein
MHELRVVLIDFGLSAYTECKKQENAAEMKTTGPPQARTGIPSQNPITPTTCIGSHQG